MNDTMKNVLIGVSVLIVLVLGIMYPKGGQNTIERVVEKGVERLGANAGTISECVDLNGVSECAYKVGLLKTSSTVGTTTPCAIQSPSATSTLLRAAINIDTSTSTAGVFTIATSTTQFATTSPLLTFTVAANSKASFLYAPTTTLSIFPPSAWIVFGVQGAAGTNGHVYGGQCTAKFQTLN